MAVAAIGVFSHDGGAGRNASIVRIDATEAMPKAVRPHWGND
jgi:hypothetical protein